MLEPAGAMPQDAWRIDNTPHAGSNEILCEVEALNIDSASFRQLCESCDSDADRASASASSRSLRERGKQHNPVTGSGGMFVGRVAAIGDDLRRADRLSSRAIASRRSSRSR